MRMCLHDVEIAEGCACVNEDFIVNLPEKGIWIFVYGQKGQKNLKI